MPPSGTAEIENVKIVSGTIFNFSSATKRHFSNVSPLFTSMEPSSKKLHSDFYRKFSNKGAGRVSKEMDDFSFQRLFTELKSDHFWLRYGQKT